MKKYIILSVLVLTFMFSIGSKVSASNLTTNQINGVAEILRVLNVSQSDISKIIAILKSNNEVKQYDGNTGKEIIPVIPKPLTGCEDNTKYNVKTGQQCSGYKAPPVLPKPQQCNGVRCASKA